MNTCSKGDKFSREVSVAFTLVPSTVSISEGGVAGKSVVFSCKWPKTDGEAGSKKIRAGADDRSAHHAFSNGAGGGDAGCGSITRGRRFTEESHAFGQFWARI